MDIDDYLLLFISLWVLIAALLSTSVSMFLTLALIGLLLAIEVGGLFLDKEQKETIKPLLEIFIIVFAIIVVERLYSLLVGGG